MGEMKRPGAEAGPVLSCGIDGSENNHSAPSLQLPQRLERAGRVVANTLHVLPAAGEPGYPGLADLLHGAAARLVHLLTAEETLAITMIGVDGLTPEHGELIACSLIEQLHAGPPPAPLLDVRDEAREWAATASRLERRAYLAACWRTLPRADRDAFRRAIS